MASDTSSWPDDSWRIRHPLPWRTAKTLSGDCRIVDANGREVVDPVANEDGMDDDIRAMIVDAVNECKRRIGYD